MLATYKSDFAQLLAPFFGGSEQELLPLIQLAPEKVP